MRTSIKRWNGDVDGQLTADGIIDGVNYHIDTRDCDTHDLGSHIVFSGTQIISNEEYHHVSLYLPHNTTVGRYPIGAPSLQIYATVSGEIAGTEYFYSAQTGEINVLSIDLANSEVNANFHFKLEDSVTGEVKNGSFISTGPKK